MPRRAAIILSPFCDNDCIFCKNQPRCSAEELMAQERLVHENIAFHLGCGVLDIEISGADPGEYDALPELIQELKEGGVQAVCLSTNGFRCADQAWVHALVEAGLDTVKIPLYGSTATVHEQVARKPGCFRAAVRALEHFKSLGANIKINSLIVRQNRENLIELYRLMLTFTDWENCFFSVPCLSNNEKSFYIPIKDLHLDTIPLIYYGMMNDTPPIFSEIPFCVFDFEYPFIHQGGPPSQGLQQPPKPYRSHIKDIPTYRLKMKPSMCKQCLLHENCDGFFSNDLNRYGTGDLHPFI